MAVSIFPTPVAPPAPIQPSTAAGWLGLGSVAQGSSSVGNFSVPSPRPGPHYLYAVSGSTTRAVASYPGTGNVWNVNFTNTPGAAYGAALPTGMTVANNVATVNVYGPYDRTTTPTTPYTATFGAGLYVFGGFGTIFTSPDLITWTQRFNMGGAFIRAIIWNGSNFIAIASEDTQGFLATSPDGITWTARTSPSINSRDVTFGAGLAVVSANNGIWTSANYTSWTQRLSNANMRTVAHNGLTAGASMFVTASDAQLFSSVDGITWTSRTNPGGQNVHSITFGNGIWVAVCDNGRIITSADGITWTVRVDNTFFSTTAFPFWGVAFASGRFVAQTNASDANGSGGLISSTDGITWRPIGTAVGGQNGFARQLTAGNNRFLVSPIQNFLQVSVDGLTGGATSFSLLSPNFPTLN